MEHMRIAATKPEDQVFDGVVYRSVSRHGSREVRESFHMFTGDDARESPMPRATETLAATYLVKHQPKLGPIHVFSREVRSTAPRDVAVGEILGRNISFAVLANPPRGLLADPVPPLDEFEFWSLVEGARDRRGRVSVLALTESLADRDPDVILAFAVRLSLILHSLDLPELELATPSSAGTLIHSGDASLDYRAWLVLQGEEVVSHALQHPTQAPRPNRRRRAEELLSAPSEAYSIRTGENVVILAGLGLDASGGEGGEQAVTDAPRWSRGAPKPYSEYQEEMRAILRRQRTSVSAPTNISDDDVWWDVNYLRDWIAVRYLTTDGEGLFVEHLDIVGRRLSEGSWLPSSSISLGIAQTHAASRAQALGHELLAIDAASCDLKKKGAEIFRIHRRTKLGLAEFTEKYIR